MNLIKKFFTSKYKKLLDEIFSAEREQKRLILPNDVILDFRHGHEYDSCSMAMLPKINNDSQTFFQEYANRVGEIININVYDCFGGDVRLLAIGEDRIFVEIVNVSACYPCQKAPIEGSKYWIGSWDIPKELFQKSIFEESELPF